MAIKSDYKLIAWLSIGAATIGFWIWIGPKLIHLIKQLL